MMPLSREQLVRHAPSGDVSRFDDGVVMLWQIPEHDLKLAMLKKTFAGVVQCQLHDIGLSCCLACPQSEYKHSTQGCEFGVDRCVGGLLFLAVRHVGRYFVASDFHGAIVAEEP